MATQEPHILITGVGGSIAVNVTRSLKMAPRPLRLYGCDASRYFIHMADMEEREVIPPSSKEKEYLSSIQRLVKKWNIDLIISSNINELLVLSRNRNSLGAHLFAPSHQAIEEGADKWKTYEILKAAKLPVPGSLLISEEKDIDHAFELLGTPVWFRGRGIPGRGVGVASLPAKTVAQAKAWIEFHEAWGNMTASEFLPGDNLTWMGLWREGNLHSSMGRKRIAYVIPHVSPSGITGAPAVSATIHDERLNELGYRAMLAMDAKYSGVGFVDFKCDKDKNPRITEVNVGRFGTTHHFYTVAGANFPYWLVQLALGESPADTKPYNVLPADLYWIRSLDAGPVMVEKKDLDRYEPKSR